MRRQWLVRGDIDGFFGLFIDNLLQLLLIVVLCRTVCGLPDNLIWQRILPGAAISILLGNLFYAWQARRLMKATGRDDVTALPYGINTPSLFAFIYLIMAPVYRQTQDATLAWQAGLFACFASGVIETAGALVADWLRRYTPRAALLSALAGIAITFIAMLFVFQLFASPAIAVIPMLLILFTYAGRLKLPLGLPGGLLAVLIGVGIAWVMRAMDYGEWQPAGESASLAFSMPRPAVTDLLTVLGSGVRWDFFAVIVPMGLFNIVGSLQNLESAEAAGDRYETRPSLLANGVGTLAASLLGSAFPTTIYIGHAGWKAMGARAAYSVLNGIVITAICLSGAVSLVLQFVPLEATLGILLWIGIIITAQAFSQVPSRHAVAVAFGLVPALAAWSYHLIRTTQSVAYFSAGGPKGQVASRLAFPSLVEPLAGELIYLHGICALNQGYLFTCMIFAATLVYVIDRRFLAAAGWMAAAAVLSCIGLIHAYELTPLGVQNKFGIMAAPAFAVTYALAAGLLVVIHLTKNQDRGSAIDGR